MSLLPRVAVGAAQSDADPQIITWALLHSLHQSGLQVQHFLSRACFCPHDGALTVTGSSSRHVDSWLMSCRVCQESFVRGNRGSDLAVVEGAFGDEHPSPGASGGSRFDTLCGWLDLPRIAVVDVSRLDLCGALTRPAKVDAIFLDQCRDDRHFFECQANFEAIWGVPVLGGLDAAPGIRAAVASLPCGEAPSAELCASLGRRFRRRARMEQIQALAERRPFPQSGGSLPRLAEGMAPVRVAVAYDAAFHGYFPDVLDQLESLGASVLVFSPLRDESLGDDVDIVYVGCGRPERYARELAENHCMMFALREHLRGGGRIYAEGGGLAYLCQGVVSADGERLPMVGALPAVARADARPQPPRPVELTLAESNWLGAVGDKVRGYLNEQWRIEPAGGLQPLGADGHHAFDLARFHQAIGSRLHLNFAAQPHILRNFLHVHPGDPSPVGCDRA